MAGSVRLDLCSLRTFRVCMSWYNCFVLFVAVLALVFQHDLLGGFLWSTAVGVDIHSPVVPDSER